MGKRSTTELSGKIMSSIYVSTLPIFSFETAWPYELKKKNGNQGSSNWIQNDSLDVTKKWLSLADAEAQCRNSTVDYIDTRARAEGPTTG